MADNTIDSLIIDVKANANTANTALDSLVKKLNTLDSSLSKINGSSLHNLSSGVAQLSHAMSAFNSSGVKTADFSRIATGLNKLANVDVQGVSDTSRAISTLTSNLSQIGTVRFDSQGIANITNALSKLGSKTATQASTNIPILTKTLKDLIVELNSLGKLNFDVSGLATLASSLSKLGSKTVTQSASNIPLLTKSLSGLVLELNKIQKIDFDINGLAMLTSSLSKLGSKTATQAIPNIRLLGTELEALIKSLSKMPAINKNVLNFVTALGNVAKGSNKVSDAVSKMNTSFGKFNVSTKSLGSQLTSLYAKLWALKNAVSGLWGSIEKSMDFLETVNYFEVVMDKIGKDNANKWKDMGYESAEVYAESFSERAKELTKKMSGFEIDKDGNATMINAPSLGIDPNAVLNAQAIYAQMANSIGLVGETSLNASKALTMLGADWASLRNIAFDDAWFKFQSALAGETEAVRALGIDVTQATLAQYAYKYGLTGTISEMDRATKTQLTLIAMLEQSRVAWGDLANTMESPSNQLRLLQGNMVSLARTIGNLFIPILEKVLPYINGFVIALQRLFQWIGSLLGIKFGSINSAIGGMGNNIADVGSGMDKVSSGADNTSKNLDKADKKAKKLRKTILGFDQLNVLNDNSKTDNDSNNEKDKGSGVGGFGGGSPILDQALADLLAEYEKAWNKAFDNMNNKAVEIADAITEAFKKLWEVAEPTRESIVRLWNEGLSKFADFSAGTLIDFWNNFLKPVGKWMLGDESGLPRFFNITNALLTEIDWDRLRKSLAEFYTALQKPTKFVWTGLMDFYEYFLKPVAVWTMGEGLPDLIDATSDFINDINWDKINSSLKKFWKALAPFAKSIGKGLVQFYKDLLKVGAKFINSVVPNGLDSLSNALKKIKPSTAEKIGYSLGVLFASITAFKGLTWIGGILGSNSPLNAGLALLATHPYVALGAGILGVAVALDKFGVIDIDWDSLKTSISNLFGAISNLASQIDWETLSNAIIKFIGAFAKVAINIGQGIIDFATNAITVLTPALASGIDLIAVALGGFADFFNSLSDETINTIGKAIAGFFAIWKIKETISNIKSFASSLGSFAEKIATLGKEKISDTKDKVSGFLGLFGGGISAPYVLAIGALVAGLASLALEIKRVNDNINNQLIQSMFDTLSNNGGTTITELSEKFTNFAESVSSSMQESITSINNIENTKKSIDDTVLNIKNIQKAIEVGAYTASEKIPELKKLFDQLLADSKTIFDEEYNVVVNGIAGGIGDVVESLGGNVPEIVSLLSRARDSITSSISDMNKSFENLNKDLENGKITQEEYNQKFSELSKNFADLKIDTSPISEAKKEFNSFKDNLDLSDIIKDGKLDTSKLEDVLTTASESFKTASKDIDNYSNGIKTYVDDLIKTSEKAGNKLDKSKLKHIDDLLLGVKKNRDENINELKNEFINIGDTIQDGLLNDIPLVVEKAQKEYAKLNLLEKFLVGSEGDYVQKALNTFQKEVMNPTLTGVQKEYDELGIDISMYAGEKATQIMDSFFDTITTYDAYGTPFITKTLKENWESEVQETMKGIGLNASQGFIDGVESKQSEVEKSGKELGDNLSKATKKSLDEHSPSKEMHQIGVFATQGFINGLESLASSLLKSAKNLGKDAINGIRNGWDSLKESKLGKEISGLSDYAKKKAGNAVNWLKEKGKDTVNGLRNGWDSLKESKIGKEVGDLSNYFKTKAGKATNYLKQKGKDTIEGLRSGWDSLKETKIGKEMSDLPSYLKTKMGNLKSKTKEKGEQIINGLKSGWDSIKESKLGAEVAKTSEYVNGKIGDLEKKTKGKGKEIISGLSSGYFSKWKDSFSATLSKTGGKIADGIGKLSENSKILEKGKQIISGIKQGWTDNWENFSKWLSDIPNQIAKGIGSLVNTGKDLVSGLVKGITSVKLPTLNLKTKTTNTVVNKTTQSPKMSTQSIRGFAVGGFPNKGELFIGNEKGIEMMGRMGNKNVVANNNQITSAIRDAVVQGMTQVLKSNNNNSQNNTPIIESKIYIGEEQIARAVTKGQQKLNRRMSPISTY